jgi:alpha-glucosidase (family GH31 glycosyl hydrolase)
VPYLDQVPDSNKETRQNMYGVHNFYLGLETGGKAHGVLLLNSAAQEITLGIGPCLTYRTIGGNFDFFFFPGPSPTEVIQQYHHLIGLPYLP